MVVEVTVVQLVLTVIGFFTLWTGTVVSVVMWLNNKFAQLTPSDVYHERHAELENRVRTLELWAAGKKNGLPP